MERLRGVKKGVLSAGHLYHPFQSKYPPGSTALTAVPACTSCYLLKIAVSYRRVKQLVRCANLLKITGYAL